MKTDRRTFLKLLLLGAASLAGRCWPGFTRAAGRAILTKTIPSSGVEIPVIGMGTWRTFDVGNDPLLRDNRTDVLREFFARGGGMIDSSPMYGSSEDVLGHGLEELGFPETLFSASKIWTSFAANGLNQVEDSKRLWRVSKFDLFQVHNLRNWQDHLKTLYELKEKGEIGHVGVTTSHGRRHEELETLMRREPLDFVQLTYNIFDREAENRLLGLAQDRGIAVIANRPYGGGDIIDRLKKEPLPAWAAEADCRSWAEFLLKFIVSHPAVTCAIPATTRVDHMRENMAACTGRLPGAALRNRMAAYVESL
jgi:diketogulonate reductase-like aldo/keto reductase